MTLIANDSYRRQRQTTVSVAMFVLVLGLALQSLTNAAQAFEPQAPTPAGSSRSTANLSLGMNLSAVNDWNREWVFVDVFKQSRTWISQNIGGSGPWDNGRPIALDAEGWPRLEAGQA